MKLSHLQEIIHLKNPDGTSRYYHPFIQRDTILSLQFTSELQGVYGSEPRVDSFRFFREAMYKNVQNAVHSLSLEKTFIPRFLLSAGVFLLVFLFLSLVIRDPVPLLDEFIISSIAAGIMWVFTLKKRIRTQDEAEQELAIREKLDSTFFQPQSSISRLELFWHTLYEETPTLNVQEIEVWLIGQLASFELGDKISSSQYYLINQGIEDELGKRITRFILKQVFTISQGNLISPRNRYRLYNYMNKNTDPKRAQAVCLIAAATFLYRD